MTGWFGSAGADWVTPAVVATAVLTTVAVVLAVPPSADRRLSRAARPVRAGPPAGLTRLAVGRADAAPLRRRLLLGAGVAIGLGAAGGALTGLGPAAWLAAPVVAAATAVVLGVLPTRATIRRRESLVRHAPQALELLAAALDAGLPARRACRVVVDAFDGPVAEDLGRVAALVELGTGDADAWRSLHEHPQFGPAADDLARSVESGTLLVDALRRHAADAREARRAALQVHARAVGVRTVLPLMVCFIPSFLLLGVVPSLVSALQHAFG